MSLDKFGCSSHSGCNLKKISSHIKSALSYTSGGDLDCENRLCNSKNTLINVDPTNNKYVDRKIQSISNKIRMITALNTNKREQKKSKKEEIIIEATNNFCMKATCNMP